MTEVRAAGEPRDRFIPIRRSVILAALIDERALAAGAAPTPGKRLFVPPLDEALAALARAWDSFFAAE
jgi:hypothetical protein